MKKKLPLLLILMIGILTPLSSTALFYVWRPEKQVNHGELLSPERPPDVWRDSSGGSGLQQMRGYWMLLMARGGDCGEQCLQRLCQMRQLRLMLPGHYLRLRRVWLITDDNTPPDALMQKRDCGEVANQQLVEHSAEIDVLDGVTLLFGETTSLPTAAASDDLYLLDPDGVWVMRFPASLTPYQIRQDMARLLKLSKGRKTFKQ